ncbi:hypothetical protein BGY98DRAFT_982038 [Russula aff. rugulosa BPL654]|nr:hypothetical protein BGY98DRAFT_982038 [Russula aff. rugulosa BPL654]
MARALVPDLEPTHAINQSRIYFPVVGWRFATSACLSRSPLPFPPHFLGTNIFILPHPHSPPLFRVISITMSPSHHTTRHIVLSTSVAFVSIRLDRRFPFRYV